MAMSVTVILTVEEQMQKFADEDVTREAKSALGELSKETTGVWAAVEKFIEWIRTKVRL